MPGLGSVILPENRDLLSGPKYDDVIEWKHFPLTGHLCGEFTGHR